MDETVMEREPPGVDEAEGCAAADAPVEEPAGGPASELAVNPADVQAGLPEQVTLQGELEAGAGSPPGRVYRAMLIRPGEWLGKGIRCAPEVLQAAAASSTAWRAS